MESPPNSTEVEFVKGWIKELVRRLDMKIMSGPYVEYCDMVGNKGITGICIIETSHIAMHVWDETSPAIIQLDVYSCGALDPKIVFDMLEPFDPVKIEYKFFDREHGLELVDTGIKIQNESQSKVA